MNKHYFFFIFLVGFFLFGNGQQVPFYNHNLINPFIYNPAMAGYDEDVNVFAGRSQRYLGYGTGSVNNYLTVDGAFFVPNSGFGLNINMQSIGLQQQFGAKLSYSYDLKINENNHLRFGISAGYLDNKIDLSGINVAQQNDPFLIGLDKRVSAFDLTAGLLYQWKNMKIGVTVPQLIGNKVKYSENDTRGYYSLARHFMGSASYDFKFLDKKDLILTPQALVRYIPGAPFQYDISARIDYEKIGWFSATYKSDYAVQFNLGFHIFKRLHIGYSYEFITNTFKNNYSGVNHEFLLGYTFNTSKKVVKERDPNKDLLNENEKLKEEIEDKNQELADQKENMEEEIKRRVEEALRKRLAEIKKEQEKEPEPEKDSTEEEQIKKLEEETNEVALKAEGYHFVEIDGSDSPDGYYVIVGVYSELKNAREQLNKVKKDFSAPYRIINTENDYSYIVIRQTKSKLKAFKRLKAYKDIYPNKKVWILYYENE